MSIYSSVSQSEAFVTEAKDNIRLNASSTLSTLATLATCGVFDDKELFIPVAEHSDKELLQLMARVDKRLRDGNYTHRLSVGFKTADPEGMIIGPIPLLNHRFFSQGKSSDVVKDSSIITVYPHILDDFSDGAVVDMTYPMTVSSAELVQVTEVDRKILIPLANKLASI